LSLASKAAIIGKGRDERRIGMSAAKEQTHRVGIIPFDTRGQAIAVLFVTSQTRGRWVLPKGKQKAGESHLETCRREGFEEAGVTGVPLEDFPITAPVTKQTKTGRLTVPVTYYPFLVTEQVDNWPEKEKRQRHWALLEEAPRVAYREDFLSVLKLFEALKPWIIETAEQHKSQQPAELTPGQ
jgi:8-oxo-dGTP pyrophosphatase MutT (NUDIX family)